MNDAVDARGMGEMRDRAHQLVGEDHVSGHRRVRV
jgi:hypothetical protein